MRPAWPRRCIAEALEVVTVTRRFIRVAGSCCSATNRCRLVKITLSSKSAVCAQATDRNQEPRITMRTWRRADSACVEVLSNLERPCCPAGTVKWLRPPFQGLTPIASILCVVWRPLPETDASTRQSRVERPLCHVALNPTRKPSVIPLAHSRPQRVSLRRRSPGSPSFVPR